MVLVTRNENERQIWFRKLGKDFKAKCENMRNPYICLSHFPPKKATSPRSKIYPYTSGKPHMFSPNADDSDTSTFDTDSECEDDEDDYEDDYDLKDEVSNVTLPETFQNVLCSWELFLPSLSKCWECMKRNMDVSAEVTINQRGAAIEAKFWCVKCGNTWNWASSELLDRKGKPGPKQYEINLRSSVSILSTGNGFSKIASFCQVMRIPMLTKRRYSQLVQSAVKPAVEKAYKMQRSKVLFKIKENVDDDDGVNLSGDGQFDSRGYSAVLCRFSTMDIRTKFLLDFEVCRKARGGNSMILEKTGHEKCLPRLLQELQDLTGIQNPVKSFTTDRCVNLSQVMKNYQTIKHFYDSWHWIRSIRKEIGEKYKQKQFEPLKCWVRPLINHIHMSITVAKGDGNVAYQMIMSFFYHIQNKHQDFQTIGNVTFGDIQKCMHAEDMSTNPNRNYLNLSEKTSQKGF